MPATSLAPTPPEAADGAATSRPPPADAPPAPEAPTASATSTASTESTARPDGSGTASAVSGGMAAWLALQRGLPLLALLLALASLVWAFNLQQRLRSTEEDLARRLMDSAQQSVEARTLARQAEAVTRDLSARLSLLEARVSESTLQRTQLEELMQSLSRSRDENVLADIEAALRVSQQQAALTGSAEPLVAVLRQTDERLARMQQPRLDRVRRAALKDLERVRAAGAVDITTLTLKLDELTRLVDELPLVSAHGAQPRREGAPSSAGADGRAAVTDAVAGGVAGPAGRAAASAPVPAPAPGAASSPAGAAMGLAAWSGLRQMAAQAWAEARELIRVTRIENPEAALLAPEQAVFLRENLRLRLLNARLSLLSRQFDSAQLDMRQAQQLLDRYFDRSSRRVIAASELLKQTAAQSRQVVIPVPEATLAALSAAASGR
ncbi:MAG: uroporphyrinogen-III C-methyltransferase [Rubrivivax sp.]|nr:uroporphyrinogen-III C-methyltransferase [Rubrivivax sp.]